MQSQTQLQAQAQAPSTAEDEVIKKNTDCVYFLASPLTCKKESECEYRHSDLARLNSRDCYYWLHGNCLNPKCSFRHPTLDGLLEKQTPTPTGPSPYTFQTNTPASANLPSASNKPAVPCIFFQKGYCLKGDWCPFLHFQPNPMSKKASLIPEPVLAFEPAASKKTFNVVDKFTQEKAPPASVAKPVKVTPQAKSSTESERAIPKLEFSVNKKTPHTSVVSDFREYIREFSVNKKTPHTSVVSDFREYIRNGNSSVHQPRLLDECRSMNDKEAGEISRELSPGFDVLVDDERKDAGYYPNKDQYELSRDHESRNEHAYGSHERFTDQYAREHGVSHERRPYVRMDSCGEIDESDLRHRLAKHKKPNGLRSAISHEHDGHLEDRRSSRRDKQHFSRRESSIGSRLRGQLGLPERSSSSIDRDMVKRSDHGRLSPVRPNMSSQPGRTRDRIKGRVEEDFSNDRRNIRDIMYDDSADFAAPKRLSELKNKKNGERSGEHVIDQQLLGKRKHLMLEDHKRSGNDASFEGPKPLQEILKRKRSETIRTLSGGNSSNNEDIVEDNNKNAGQDSVNQNEGSKVQSEDNIVEDGAEPEYEAYEEEEGEFDYEQVGDEKLDLYDGENGDIEGEEEFHEGDDGDDDDDDDDFAKKMGVEFS